VVDYTITTLAFFGQSMPVFWFALMLQLAFAVTASPRSATISRCRRRASRRATTFDLGDRIEHLILPTIVLSLLYIATWSRFTRSSMLEVIRTDYMRTAPPRGLDKLTIILRHGLKNALIPVVTIIALSLPGPVCGRGRHRDDLRLAGHGAAVLQRARSVRFLAADGLSADRLVPGRVLQPGGRRCVRLARPAGEV
jgi:hypothetical protein